MKCPSCGYFNVPGLAQCGACGLALRHGENSAQLADWQDVLPPRARQRTSSQKVEHGLGRTGRIGFTSARRARESARVGVNATQEWWRRQLFDSGLLLRYWLSPHHWRSVGREYRALIVAVASIVPGLGQALQHRPDIARTHFAAALLIGGLAVLLFGALFAGMLWLCLLSLIGYSVWEATMHGLPEPDGKRAEALRPWRAACFAVLCLSLMLSGAGALLDNRVALVRVGMNVGKTIHRGDTLLMRRATDPRRGDIVVANVFYTNLPYQVNGPVCERVLALPGDLIEGRQGRLWVNGRPLTSAEMPLVAGSITGDFAQKVPSGSVALRSTIIGEVLPGEPTVPQPLYIVPEDEIEGCVMAILGPPTHRRWLR